MALARREQFLCRQVAFPLTPPTSIQRVHLLSVLNSIFDTLLLQLLTIFDQNVDRSKERTITRIRKNEVFSEDSQNLSARLDGYKNDLRLAAQSAFEKRTSPSMSLSDLVELAGWIEERVVIYEKSYQEPLLGSVRSFH